MEWANIPREEQETIINIDYEERKLYFYTTRKSVGNKLIKKAGKPTKTETIDGKVASVSYERNLWEKDIRSFLTVGTLVGGFRQSKGLE